MTRVAPKCASTARGAHSRTHRDRQPTLAMPSCSLPLARVGTDLTARIRVASKLASLAFRTRTSARDAHLHVHGLHDKHRYAAIAASQRQLGLARVSRVQTL